MAIRAHDIWIMDKGFSVKITDKCQVDLINFMGDDLTVVNAARVSFDKASSWDESTSDFDGSIKKSLPERDAKLIRYLAKHGHYTPFTHGVITMRETVPQFVARQRFKHVVGFSYNEVSRRYVEDEPEFFIPDNWRGKAANKKQGSSDESVSLDVSMNFGSMKAFCKNALRDYKTLLDCGVCPEQARMILPQNMMTSYYVTGSLSAWARAFNLRADPSAQKEIRDLSGMWDLIIRPLFPISWEALCAY